MAKRGRSSSAPAELGADADWVEQVEVIGLGEGSAQEREPKTGR